jgi:hypothetical protein
MAADLPASLRPTFNVLDTHFRDRLTESERIFDERELIAFLREGGVTRTTAADLIDHLIGAGVFRVPLMNGDVGVTRRRWRDYATQQRVVVPKGGPSQDRQDDILSAIRSEETPLTRPDLVRVMRLKSEGSLGRQLAWMVKNKVLVKIPRRGYWPADCPIPE